LSAPPRTLQACELAIELGERPWLMGIVNASSDSFSDGGMYGDLDARVELARRLLADGADIIDIGGESAITGRPPVPVEEELELVVPLVEGVARGLGALVSVDTYKPRVAAAAIAAGARIVNDVSGLRDPELAEVCARTGAALVLMHTRAAPRERLQDPGLYGDLAGEVLEFLRERMALAVGAGCRPEQLLVDPGPDFTKTPAQTVELLRELPRMHELGRPLLLAVSRKDFIGALTGRPPRERLAGTLAAFDHGVACGAHIVRLHDIREAADFLTVRAALSGELELDPQLALQDRLRHER
jgi:dihydropteroate synthase